MMERNNVNTNNQELEHLWVFTDMWVMQPPGNLEAWSFLHSMHGVESGQMYISIILLLRNMQLYVYPWCPSFQPALSNHQIKSSYCCWVLKYLDQNWLQGWTTFNCSRSKYIYWICIDSWLADVILSAASCYHKVGFACLHCMRFIHDHVGSLTQQPEEWMLSQLFGLKITLAFSLHSIW